MAPLTGIFVSQKIVHHFPRHSKRQHVNVFGALFQISLFDQNLFLVVNRLFWWAKKAIAKNLDLQCSHCAQIMRSWWRVALLIHTSDNDAATIIYPATKSLSPYHIDDTQYHYKKQQWRTWCTDDRNDIAMLMYVTILLLNRLTLKLVWIFDFAHAFIHYRLFQQNVCPMTKFIRRIGSLMSHCDNRTNHRITLNYIAQSMLLWQASIACACL